MAHLFLVNNLIDQSEIEILTGDVASQFPLENIQDAFTTKKCRINSNTCEILIDTNSLSPKDTIMLVGSSVDGLGFSLASLFSSATLDFTSSTEIVIDVSQEFNMAWKQFTAISDRYFKLTFTGTGSYTEISNIFIGEATVLTDSAFSREGFAFAYLDNSDIQQNKYGSLFVNQNNRLTKINGIFKVINREDRETLEQINIEKGLHIPIMVILSPEDQLGINTKYRYSGYFYFRDNIEFTSINGNYFTCAFNLIQAG